MLLTPQRGNDMHTYLFGKMKQSQLITAAVHTSPEPAHTKPASRLTPDDFLFWKERRRTINYAVSSSSSSGTVVTPAF